MRGYKNFDGSPHPGNLRHRIEIGYTQSTVNENGYPDAEDIVLCRQTQRMPVTSTTAARTS